MADMNVKLMLEVQAKGLQHLKAIQNATRGLAAAQVQANGMQAAGSARAEANARKAAQATRQQTDAVKAQAAATKAAAAVESEAAARRQAEMARRREAYRAFDRETRAARNAAREPHWQAYWDNRNAAKAEAEANRAAAAQKKVTDAVRQTGQEAARTEGILRRMGRAVSGIGWGKIGAAAGVAIGATMGQAIAARIKDSVGTALRNAWTSARGGAVGLMQAGRANAGNALVSARTFTGQAGVNAVSNAQRALDFETRLRPEVGGSLDAARAIRQHSDKWGGSAPFQTEDVRAAAMELSRGGLDPRQSGLMDMLGNAAANRVDQGETMQSVARAWSAATRGDYSQLGAFGLNASTDASGNSFVSAMVGDKMQKIMLDAEKGAETLKALQTAISSRFSGQMFDRSMTPEGMLIRAQNAWESFMGKVVDAGPLAYITDLLKRMLGYSSELGETGLDALATSLGERFRSAMESAEQKVLSIWLSLKSMASTLDPIVNMLGGWGNVIAILVALPFVSYLSTIVIALGVVATGLAAVTTAVWSLGAALMATPVGWIVAGLVALAAAAYLIYANWGQIGPWLANLWNEIATGISAGWDAAKAAIAAAATGAVEGLKAAWDGVTGWIASTIAGWIEAAKGAFAAIGDAFSGFDPIGKIATVLEPVLGWIATWGARIGGAFETAIGVASGIVDGAWSRISAVWEKITGAVNTAKSWVGLGTTDPNAGANDQIRRGMGAAEANGHLERLKTLMPEVQAAVAGFSILPALQSSIGAAEGYLAGVSFHSHGVAMMQTLAAGMRAGAGAAIAAVQQVTQQIRDHLPHSPAKVGPLSDLHQIRFSETLAMGIQAGPAVAAVEGVVAGMRRAAGPSIGISSGVDGAGAGSAGGSRAGEGGGNVTYSPNITINGSSLDRESLLDVLRRHAYEAEEILAGQRRNRDRLSYGGAV